jgi:hypothetical protein
MVESHTSLAQATFRRALPYAIDGRAFSPFQFSINDGKRGNVFVPLVPVVPVRNAIKLIHNL